MKKRRDIIHPSKITFVGIGFLAVAIMSYLYFLNMSVVQVVMRTEFVEQQQDVTSEIAHLETKYIEAQHDIAAQIADLGEYTTHTSKLFVSRDRSSLVLGGN